MLGKLNESEINELLLGNVIGRIGCHANGKTLVVPITYAFDGQRILGHSAVGEKIQMMRENPRVCFEVDEVKDLRNWKSAVLQGTFTELHGDEASVAMSFLVEKVMPRMPGETVMLAHGGISIRPRPEGSESDTVVFCLQIREKSGRFEKW